MKIPQSICYGSGFGLCLSLCKSQLNLPKALWGGKKREGNGTGTGQHSIYPVMIVKRRENSPNGSMYSTQSRASRGFTDRFNYSKALCCCGDGLLLTCCFPKGEEVSQPPVPTQGGEVISGHMYCRVCTTSCAYYQLNLMTPYSVWTGLVLCREVP